MRSHAAGITLDASVVIDGGVVEVVQIWNLGPLPVWVSVVSTLMGECSFRVSSGETTGNWTSEPVRLPAAPALSAHPLELRHGMRLSRDRDSQMAMAVACVSALTYSEVVETLTHIDGPLEPDCVVLQFPSIDLSSELEEMVVRGPRDPNR